MLLIKFLVVKFGVGLLELQVIFLLLIILQIFFFFFQGWLVEKFGLWWLIVIGIVMVGMSWVFFVQVNGLVMFWLVYGCMGGFGIGIVYIGVVGLMVKWFLQQWGFVVGVVVVGYGMGVIIIIFFIFLLLIINGFEYMMMIFGIFFVFVGFFVSQGLKLLLFVVFQFVSQMVVQSSRLFIFWEMLCQLLFWLMFVMMVMMLIFGLMVILQMVVFVEDFGISQVVVFGMVVLLLVLMIDCFINGLIWLLFGFIFDCFGCE